MKERERLTAEGKMKLRSSVLREEARRKKRVPREKQRKAAPVHRKCWRKESGGRVPEVVRQSRRQMSVHSSADCSRRNGRLLSFLII